MTESTPSVFRWVALGLFILLLLFLIHWPAVEGGIFSEKDMLWLLAGEAGTQWLPYFDHLSDLFDKPIMRAVEGAKPGQWIVHVFITAVLGDNPQVQLGFAIFLFAINSILLGIISFLLFKRWLFAVATALFFALHPQLSGVCSSISSLAELVSLFWILVSIIGMIRYKQHGRMIQIIPVICGVFLAVSTSDLGLIAVPVLLLVDLGTTTKGWTVRTAGGVAFRFFLNLLPVLWFLYYWIPAGSLSGLIRIYVALRMVKPVPLAIEYGLERMLFPLPASLSYGEFAGGLTIGRILLYATPILFGLLLALVYQNKRRLIPIGMILFSLFFQIPNLIAVRAQSAQYSFLFLVMVAGFALLVGELLPRIQPKAAGIMAVFALACFFATGSHMSARYWGIQGALVRTMADQIHETSIKAADTSEILIVKSGKYGDLQKAAFLEFTKRYGALRQVRYSIIQDGLILPGLKGGAVGKSQRGVSRLPLERTTEFLVFSEKAGLVNVSERIYKKIDAAGIVIQNEKMMPKRWPLASVLNIRSWSLNPENPNMIPVDDFLQLEWFVQGRITPMRLIGRRLL